MTRVTKMGRKTHLEATPYDRPASPPPPPAAGPPEGKRRALPSQNEMEESLGLKKERRSENRRQKRETNRNRGKVCFNCRREGHRAQDCPESTTTTTTITSDGKKPARQICYRCGKSDHSLKQCRLHPSKGLPFAECFVCKERGHITSNCPTNGNGIYPDGGSCKICRSVEHLAKDCPLPDEVRLGTVVGTAGHGVDIGADDDDFHDVAKVEMRRGKTSTGRGPPSSMPLSGQKARKVVAF